MKQAKIDDVQFDRQGLVPVVVQRIVDGRVLMLAYASRRAVELTLETGWAHFYSRSRDELWKKGSTSGNVQKVGEIQLDCDGDSLLYMVEEEGPACHTGHLSCFFRQVDSGDAWRGPARSGVLFELYDVIESRKESAPEGSYVRELLDGEWELPLRKVGEEATEVLLAALAPGQPNLPAEMADLWFHCLVLLSRCDRDLEEVLDVLRCRRR